jgi:urease accessory protein
MRNQKVMRAWHANLTMRFRDSNEGRTVLRHVSHEGPLRVQRAFYPRNTPACHVYWLHPPGGLVNGDRVDIDVSADGNSNVLLTTPSAGRIYRSLGQGLKQRQQVQLTVAANAALDWLPQETLVFDGADTELGLHIDCSAGARFVAWDIVCLGRPAAEEKFLRGRLRQRIEVWRDGRCIYNERWQIDGDDAALAAPWGWRGCHTQGCLLAQAVLDDAAMNELRLLLGIEQHAIGAFTLTQRLGLVMVRYLGNAASEARRGFTLAWQFLHRLQQSDVVVPRIWAT